WDVVSLEMGGEFRPVVPGVADAVFAGDRVTLDINTDNKGEGAFTLDPTRDPKEIDVTPANGAGRKLGIYRLEGDRLTLRLGAAGARRPKRFETGDTSTAVVLRRATAAEVKLPDAAEDSGVLTLHFEPGNYSEKIQEFGVVVNVVGPGRKTPRQ